MKRLDKTSSGDLLDKMVALSNTYARREISRLRRLLAANGAEGRALWAKYHCTSADLPHDVEDFLQSAGD